MSRYRPSTPRGTPYITAEGFARLQQELKALWQRRAGVRQALSAAAAEGDRSENAEYIYRKKELAGIDRRIRYLQKRLPELRVAGQTPDDPQRIFFGAWVTLEDEDGRAHAYRIVGGDEFDPARGWISIDSPMARALLNRTLDDEVEVRTPEGRRHYRVVAVRYGES